MGLSIGKRKRGLSIGRPAVKSYEASLEVLTRVSLSRIRGSLQRTSFSRPLRYLSLRPLPSSAHLVAPGPTPMVARIDAPKKTATITITADVNSRDPVVEVPFASAEVITYARPAPLVAAVAANVACRVLVVLFFARIKPERSNILSSRGGPA